MKAVQGAGTMSNKPAIAPVDQSVTYTLSLTVTRPVWKSDEDAAVWMVGSLAKRELEREVLAALRRLDGDCDIEVMETRLVEG
jgi:hypothetical protein